VQFLDLGPHLDAQLGVKGTLLAMVYLVIIVIAMTVLMKLADRFARPRT
jgi:hypothetical protein